MQEFIKQFKVDKKNAEIAGVCAGLAHTYHIKVEYMRLIWAAAFILLGNIGIFVPVAYAYLAGWLQRDYPWDKASKKARNQFVFVILLSILLPLYGVEMIEAVYEFGRQTGVWLVSLF